MVVVRVLIRIVETVQGHLLILVGIPTHALIVPASIYEHVTLGGGERIVMFASNGVVETENRASGRGGNPADALVTPSLVDEMVALDRAHGEEMLTRVGIVEAQHQMAVGGATVVGIARIIRVIRVARIVRIRRLGIARDLELGGCRAI